ncbi:myb-binding protein 1A-like isoform X2 [Amphibalanus amphitrite]|uniref:myb-binding protein 1A-like isoform X2 n=1 Tax=Amphibalanus amphitrite TaxID=1232801 RepID=UPI001C915319|nr:myb-binding protein 1A-like isoform X2 [Amphibalanus amphitrite]XP_043243297.1 myb-binding protein 1A-like isoform X2 [Amphibalanus amphitrite]
MGPLTPSEGTTKGSVTLKNNVPSKILSLFSDLTEHDTEKRLKSVVLLIHQVVNSEKKVASDGIGPTASYCLTRLVRGLASSRAGAREGFFTGLVLLLRRLPALDTAALLAAVDAHLPDVRGDPRQATEHRIGRLLAAGAAVRAGHCSQLDRLTAALLEGWHHRAYMPPMVSTFIEELLLRVSEEQFSGSVWPQLKELLAAGWDGCTPERLWMLLVSRRQFPDVVDSRFLKQHWGSKKVFSPKNYENILQMIKVSAGSLPAIHPLVGSLATLAVERSPAELLSFGAAVLEPLLDDRTADVALLAMAMVQLMVAHLNTPEMLESVLTPALVGALVRLLPKRDRRTEQVARGLGSALVGRVLAPDSSAELQLTVISRLVSPPGSINFDHMTGTKILAQMLNGLKADALEPFSKTVLSCFEGTSSDRNLTPRGRAVACDLLCRLVQHPSAPGRTPLKERLLERLFAAGVLRDDSVSDELAATALRAFFRALEHPVRRLADLTELLRGLMERQRALLRADGAELRAPLSPEARAAWDAAAKAMRKLRPGAGPDTDVFIILLGHLSQQLFGTECAAAVDALQELHACLERQQQLRRSAEEPVWSEVVVDLLLSLLALNVHLLRNVVRSVFTLLAPTLSPEALLYAFQPLNPDFKMNSRPGDDAEGEMDEQESGSEDESAGEEDSAEEDDEDEDEWEDESSGAEEEGENAAEDTDQLETMRAQVKAALGGDSEDDAVSVDLDDVPEEHLAKVDEALGAAFRAMRKDKRMKGGNRPTDEQLAMMHFRIRVLDLVDVYVRACPRSAAALGLLSPMVSLLSSCATDSHQAPLLGRLRACLKRLTAAGGRLPERHGLTQTLLAELLQDVLTSGARLPAFSLELGGLLAAAVRLLVRTSAQLGGDQTEVISALSTALDAFFTDRECVYPARTFGQLLALPGWPRGWTLVTPLLDAAFSDRVRPYRRTQAFQLVTTAAKNRAMVGAVPSAEVESAAARLEAGIHQLVSDVSAADGVRTKYVTCALEALLALRRAAGLTRPVTQLAAQLTELGQKFSLSKYTRSLIARLAQTGPRPEGMKNAKLPKNNGTAAAPADVSEPVQDRPRKRAGSCRSTAVDEGDGSVDSGVEEVASDAEPPKKKKIRPARVVA